METVKIIRQYRTNFQEIEERLVCIPQEYVPNRVLRTWELGGLLVPAWRPPEPAEVERLWINVCTHMASTAVLVYSLASNLIEHPFSEEEMAHVIEAALVHDAFKRHEQEAIARAKLFGQDAGSVNREAEAASIEFLQAAGIGDAVVRLAGMTGDHGLQYFMGTDGTLLEQILFYADCCTSGNYITTYQKRFDRLRPQFQPGGYYDHVNHDFIARYGRTHREIFDSVVLPIGESIARSVGFRDEPDDFPLTFVAVEFRAP